MSQHIGPRTISAIGGSIKRVGNYRIHTFPSELITDGLLLNLDAGDPRSYPGSGTTWTDLSGNGNNGTLTNGPTYSNANGGSIVFDGSNDYVTCGNGSLLNFGRNNFNISCWIKTSATNAEYSSIISKYNNAQSAGPWIQLSNNSSKFVVFGIDGSNFLTSSTSVNNNVWRNISCQRTGLTNLEIYVDGVLVSSENNTANVDCTQTENLVIGAMNLTSLQRWFSGNISNVTIYNRALSAAEVAQNYDALKVRYTSYTNTFTPICAGGEGKVEVLCVAGGGAGGKGTAGGGGGSGGLLYNSAFTVNSNTGIGVTVGAGGTGTTTDATQATNGGNSVFGSLTSVGGGYGGNENGSVGPRNGNSGGSGGGGSYHGNGGNGTTGQGNAGGTGTSGSLRWTGGGGGGAGSAGASATSYYGGDGGSGLAYSISGTSSYYAGGGGGAAQSSGGGTVYGGIGGNGGGGTGPADQSGSQVIPGMSAIPNTGGGGSGGVDSLSVSSGNGANGIVIVRYPASDYNVELLIVGGGGGGGLSVGSGGGAGGLIYYSSYPVSSGTKYTVTVGAGSTGMTNTAIAASNGNNSVFGSLVAFGGGGGTGQSVDFPNGAGGKLGGSGSGGSRNQITPGNGVSGQGNRGGFGNNSANGYGGGGGGGAGGVGGDGSASSGGNGGIGLAYSITGTSTYYAGGGGGSSNYGGVGIGGLGGGGAGSSSNVNGVNGTTNTGGGGGGADAAAGATAGGSGGSGIVIIAYRGPQRGIGGTVDTTSRPGYTLHKFTATGTDFFIP